MWGVFFFSTQFFATFQSDTDSPTKRHHSPLFFDRRTSHNHPLHCIFAHSVRPKWSCFLSTKLLNCSIHGGIKGWRKRGKAKQKKEVNGWLRGWHQRITLVICSLIKIHLQMCWETEERLCEASKKNGGSQALQRHPLARREQRKAVQGGFSISSTSSCS